MKKLLAVLVLIGISWGPAFALDQVTVKERLGVEPTSIKESPVPGLFEIVTPDSRVVYMDATGHYVIVGNMYDVINRQNITQERMDELSQIDFSTLPLDKAVAMGSGPKKVAVFDDPDCPYCRKLHGELKQLKDTTVYVFLFPLDMHKDAYGKSRKIWCAEDKVAALDDAMGGGNLENLKDCDAGAVIDEVKQLSNRIGVRSTPTVFLQNGKMVRGYKPAAELQRDIDAAAKDAGSGSKTPAPPAKAK